MRRKKVKVNARLVKRKDVPNDEPDSGVSRQEDEPHGETMIQWVIDKQRETRRYSARQQFLDLFLDPQPN